jgi:hypothetical protein
MSSTTVLPCENTQFVLVSGTPVSCNVYWSSVSGALRYEVEVRHDRGVWSELGLYSLTSLTYTNIPTGTKTLQFRVRTSCLYLSSGWVVSNELLFRYPTAKFVAHYDDAVQVSPFFVYDLGDSVNFTDISETEDLPLVSRVWKFYNDKAGIGSYTTSTELSPNITCRTSGSFAVSLTVIDESGYETTTLKPGFMNVDCFLDVNFSGISIYTSESSEEYLTVTIGESIAFNDLTEGNVVYRKWKFYSDVDGYSYNLGSSVFSPINRYYKTGEFAVGLKVTGEYGQESEIIKPRFIRVIDAALLETTTTTVSTTASTSSSLTTTFATTVPPDDWREAPNDGIPISSSEDSGSEAYRAFDYDSDSFWRPTPPLGFTESTTLTTSTSVTSTTGYTEVLNMTLPDTKLWEPSADVQFFRSRFVDLFLNNRVLKVVRYETLPVFTILLHEGIFVYDDFTKYFYVGTNLGWERLNQAQLRHVLQHVSGGPDQFITISDSPPVSSFLNQVWVDTTGDITSTATTTVTTTTASSTYCWTGNIAVRGPWGYSSCSGSFDGDHTDSEAFDCDYVTYWMSSEVPSDIDPVWIEFYWLIPRIIKVYRVYRENGDGIPSSWELKASNNGIVWYTLHSVRDTIVEICEYFISNSSAYKHYRLFIYETQDGRNAQLNSLEFFENNPLLSSTSTLTTTSTTSSSTTSYF